MMHVTQNLAELCTLLIDELYGELPSRIFSVLLSRGRSTIAELARYTSMDSTQIKHGLIVLIQYNLLFFQSSAGPTVYQANPEFAYNLVRAGKILEMVEGPFGPAGKDVMQNLMITGQTRVSDLLQAYQSKIARTKAAAEQAMDLEFPDFMANGADGKQPEPKKPDTQVKSTAHVNSILCRLVEAELVDVVHSKSFQSPEDIVKEAEDQVVAQYFPNGVKGGKGKADYEQKVAEVLRKVRSESKSLKRKLESNGAASKRRKMFVGIGPANGTSNGAHDEELDPALDPSQVVRINYEKCLVELRNRRLVQFVSDRLGETTSYVYGILLKLLTKKLSRCQSDTRLDIAEDGDETQGLGVVTSNELLDSMKTSIDLSLGIGKVAKHESSARAAEKIRENPPKPKLFIEAAVDGEASADEAESDAEESSEYDSDYEEQPAAPAANGTKVKFAGGAAAGKEQRMDRPTQLRQHLLLLAESQQRFVRHCGTNEWTVDFAPLLQIMREAEMDTVIERTSGKEGLRLIHILRTNGKLDEKALQNIALMRKAELQQKMLQMMMAGFVQTQEVPRDTKADVKKSIFLWYVDLHSSSIKVLDTSYKSMVRCIQVLGRLRRKEKDILMLTKRTDVKGREKDVMRTEYYERYSRFQNHEKQLFAQVSRLDDVVALLRDF